MKRKVGDFNDNAHLEDIDEAGFISALTDKLAREFVKKNSR